MLFIFTLETKNLGAKYIRKYERGRKPYMFSNLFTNNKMGRVFHHLKQFATSSLTPAIASIAFNITLCFLSLLAPSSKRKSFDLSLIRSRCKCSSFSFALKKRVLLSIMIKKNTVINIMIAENWGIQTFQNIFFGKRKYNFLQMFINHHIKEIKAKYSRPKE